MLSRSGILAVEDGGTRQELPSRLKILQSLFVIFPYAQGATFKGEPTDASRNRSPYIGAFSKS
jgi:hypothetical protein